MLKRIFLFLSFFVVCTPLCLQASAVNQMVVKIDGKRKIIKKFSYVALCRLEDMIKAINAGVVAKHLVIRFNSDEREVRLFTDTCVRDLFLAYLDGYRIKRYGQHSKRSQELAAKYKIDLNGTPQPFTTYSDKLINDFYFGNSDKLIGIRRYVAQVITGAFKRANLGGPARYVIGAEPKEVLDKALEREDLEMQFIIQAISGYRNGKKKRGLQKAV